MERLEEKDKIINEKFEQKMEQINQLMLTLEPLINLPKAFSQTVLSNPEQIRNGTAKKVNDILGFNDDNIQKHINNSTKVGE